MQPLTELKEKVTELPRGGYLVDTKAGYIQFGSPPETMNVSEFVQLVEVKGVFSCHYSCHAPPRGDVRAERAQRFRCPPFCPAP